MGVRGALERSVDFPHVGQDRREIVPRRGAVGLLHQGSGESVRGGGVGSDVAVGDAEIRQGRVAREGRVVKVLDEEVDGLVVAAVEEEDFARGGLAAEGVGIVDWLVSVGYMSIHVADLYT